MAHIGHFFRILVPFEVLKRRCTAAGPHALLFYRFTSEVQEWFDETRSASQYQRVSRAMPARSILREKAGNGGRFAPSSTTAVSAANEEKAAG
jgi:hypothetical protein